MNTIARKLFLVAAFLAPSLAFSDHHESGFLSLFDGKSLKGWDGNPQFWSVQDGALTGITTPDNPTKGNTFLVYRGADVDDFELRLTYRIIGGNSGIQYRAEDIGNWVIAGYQADIDSKDTYSGILYDEKRRGILAQRGQVVRLTSTADGKKSAIDVIGNIGESMAINKAIKKEDWNEYKIVARGNQLTHSINGRVTCVITDEDTNHSEQSGVLAFQLHAGPPMKVQFKNVRLKPLKPVKLSGQWKLEVQSEAGTGTPSFTFNQEGEKLTGDYSGLFGDRKFQGQAKGESYHWSVAGDYDGASVESTYQATLTSLTEMRGSVTFDLDGQTATATFTGKKL